MTDGTNEAESLLGSVWRSIKVWWLPAVMVVGLLGQVIALIMSVYVTALTVTLTLYEELGGDESC